MLFDCRDERHGVWRQLRPGAHQLVSSTLEAQPILFELISHNSLAGPALYRAVHLIVRYTSNCIGQLVKAQRLNVPATCCFDPTRDDSCVLKHLGSRTIDDIATEVAQDVEFLDFWNGIWEDEAAKKGLKGDLVSWADYVGVIRLSTRMAGCCIGQALSLNNLSLFALEMDCSASAEISGESLSA